MELPEDPTKEILLQLCFEDIINLKKSGEISKFSDIKLREILGKKFLNKIKIQYKNNEYPDEDIFTDEQLHPMISRFCFYSLIMEFGDDIKITSEQIDKMISILTVEQLEKMNDKINNGMSWY